MRGGRVRLLAPLGLCLLLSGCSFTSGLQAASGGNPSASASPERADAQAYTMVMRHDLQPIESYASACEDLSEQDSCVKAMGVLGPAITQATTDLGNVRVPHSLSADHAALLAALAGVQSACGPVEAARGNVAEAYADTAYSNAQTRLLAAATQLQNDANALN